MYHSLRKNEAVASEISGIQLHTYVSGEGGYPPCGLPLLSDSTVDMNVTLDESAGTVSALFSLHLIPSLKVGLPTHVSCCCHL